MGNTKYRIEKMMGRSDEIKAASKKLSKFYPWSQNNVTPPKIGRAESQNHSDWTIAVHSRGNKNVRNFFFTKYLASRETPGTK